MNLYEAIFVRKSVRRYSLEPLSVKLLDEIRSYEGELTGLFPEIHTEFHILDNTKHQHKAMSLLGVKAPYYLAIYSEKKDKYMMNAGYLMEQMSLFLCTRGLGSCFVGLRLVSAREKKSEDMDLVILLAFGKSKGSHVRKTVDFDRRPLKELCVFKETPRQWIKEILGAARLAPSSLNSQPWRFVVYDNRIHVFSKNKDKGGRARWDELNFGILFSHMMIVAEELWLDVDLIRLENISQQNFAKSQYVLSAILKA